MIDPWHICVLIPARNEEVLLPRCLNSVLVACGELPITATCDVIVAVDSSTDLSREIAENALGPHGKVVITTAQAVGRARALAADTALSRYTGPLNRCWLANTDADCSVPKSWLVDQLLIASQGVEATAGTVTVDSFEEHQPAVELRFRDSYVINPDGSHPHVHGANLGIRADVYRRIGGWRDLVTAEDHDLWNRLKGCGSSGLSIARLAVSTSGRRTGRAPLGFAGALSAHNEVLA